MSYHDLTPLFSPSKEEEEPGMGREEKGTEQGSWELQVGRPGVAQQGFSSPYSCSQDPAVGLRSPGAGRSPSALGSADAMATE